MLLTIPNVLSKDAVARLRGQIDAATWVDGNVTSGRQSAMAKHNLQLPEESAAARAAGNLILDALEKAPLFIAAALPLKIFPPLFNRYGVGQTFGMHVDNALRVRQDGQFRIRADLSATLFLSEPEDYDGGELIIEDTYGGHSVKLAAGDMVLYPSSSLHRVEPVTRGARVASFFWIQSMVRETAQRALLFDMDMAIQQLSTQVGIDHPAVISLTGNYHNLLRMWADI
ncbi:MAG: Fe2+-dependent dioxygenase [Caulobacterales bacterium]|jgi:PKHD-type hydroxylase|nr:Fe2+-dependent dioxygenase [Caulobacterales bacterium]